MKRWILTIEEFNTKPLIYAETAEKARQVFSTENVTDVQPYTDIHGGISLMIKKLDEPLYLYEHHLGGLYTTTDVLDFDSLYCEQCGDSDFYLGSFSTLAEFWELITYPNENEFRFDLQYIYPLAVRYFYLSYTVTYRDKKEERYGMCCNSDEEIISNINKSIKECEK